VHCLVSRDDLFMSPPTMFMHILRDSWTTHIPRLRSPLYIDAFDLDEDLNHLARATVSPRLSTTLTHLWRRHGRRPSYASHPDHLLLRSDSFTSSLSCMPSFLSSHGVAIRPLPQHHDRDPLGGRQLPAARQHETQGWVDVHLYCFNVCCRLSQGG
jgi:hypothetical protein